MSSRRLLPLLFLICFLPAASSPVHDPLVSELNRHRARAGASLALAGDIDGAKALFADAVGRFPDHPELTYATTASGYLAHRFTGRLFRSPEGRGETQHDQDHHQSSHAVDSCRSGRASRNSWRRRRSSSR